MRSGNRGIVSEGTILHHFSTSVFITVKTTSISISEPKSGPEITSVVRSLDDSSKLTVNWKVCECDTDLRLYIL